MPIKIVVKITINGEMNMFSPRKLKINNLKTSLVIELIRTPILKNDFEFNFIFSNFH